MSIAAVNPLANLKPASGPRVPAIRVVAAPLAPMSPDLYSPNTEVSVRLGRINEAAGHLLGRALKQMVRSPGQTAKSFVALTFEPFLHPLRAIQRCKESFQHDGQLSGLLTSSLYVSATVTTLSFLAMGAALLLAPFTGGASLAILPFASAVMVYTGIHDAVVTTAMLAKDEYDAAHADTEEKVLNVEARLADDYLNTFFAWVTLPLSDAHTALTVAPQGMLTAARGAIKPGLRSAGMRHLKSAATQSASGGVRIATTRAAARAVDVGTRSDTRNP
jgi:hypothetical protein